MDGLFTEIKGIDNLEYLNSGAGSKGPVLFCGIKNLRPVPDNLLVIFTDFFYNKRYKRYDGGVFYGRNGL